MDLANGCFALLSINSSREDLELMNTLAFGSVLDLSSDISLCSAHSSYWKTVQEGSRLKMRAADSCTLKSSGSRPDSAGAALRDIVRYDLQIFCFNALCSVFSRFLFIRKPTARDHALAAYSTIGSIMATAFMFFIYEESEVPDTLVDVVVRMSPEDVPNRHETDNPVIYAATHATARSNGKAREAFNAASKTSRNGQPNEESVLRPNAVRARLRDKTYSSFDNVSVRGLNTESRLKILARQLSALPPNREVMFYDRERNDH
ncbi:hypothetical protein EVAR_67827_1 [Eumeta japonica]|uniref:Uncharacterized protein n=1 Tax=Eumeta variegata TaxID=151549 RepID=A0A4C1ZV51_EUMVA|nr:hypothetical protein EVAR_67827_1 [Eumeta japonica]